MSVPYVAFHPVTQTDRLKAAPELIMPFIDEFETLRVGAGLRVSAVAKEADLSRDTLLRIKKHKNVTKESLVSAVNALNNLYYGKNGSKLDPEKLITDSSRFGGNP